MKKIILFSLFCLFASFAVANETKKMEPSNVLTPEQKVYGLSHFWSTVNSHFVFLHKVDPVVWDSTYKASLKEALESKNDWEYYKILQKLSAVLNDGHTGTYGPIAKLSQTRADNPNDVFLPQRTNLFDEGYLLFKEVENKIVVDRVSTHLLDKLPLGAELITVNDMPVEEYIAQYTVPYISQSAAHVKRNSSVGDITKGLYGNKLNVTVKKESGSLSHVNLRFGGDTFPDDGETVSLTTDLSKEWKLSRLTWRDDIAIVELNAFYSKGKLLEEFKAMLPELKNASALVIDIRGNGGGNSAEGSDILQYLVTDSVFYGSHSETREILPAYRAWGAYCSEKDTIGNEFAAKSYLAYHNRQFHTLSEVHTVKVTTKIEERVIIPTAILTGMFTASAAEDFLIYADKQKHMVRIGSKTFGSTGQPIDIDLGAGFEARVCTKNDTYPDGTPFIGVGILPHIEVEPTLEDYKTKRDAVLEKAIEYLRKQ